MVFSLFGKKPQPEPGKAAAKKKAPASPAVSRPAAPKSPPEPPPAPREELESLDFTSPGAIEVHEVEDHSGQFEIRESSATLHPVIEEAAILFANGQDEAALLTLEAAVDGNQGAEADQAWAMLFDLYQIMGKRELFDRRAFEYSIKYEKSPPTWVEPARQALGPALATGGTAFVSFSGMLGEASDKQIRQLEKIISSHPVARVDFGKLQDADVLGAEMLFKAMAAARKTKCELVMNGAEKLADLLKRRIEPGRQEGEAFWLLLLELYQHMALQDPFEEWAVNYAVTFEVSPPSWENRPARKKPASAAASSEAPADPDVFSLAGEMLSAGSDAFRHLIVFSENRQQVVIDCAALRRMDFVSAGLFLNTLTNLQMSGSSVTIRNPNQLLFALFGVLGINQVAHVERRKF